MAVLNLQIAPQVAATLPHVARQTFRLKTKSLFRVSERDLIVVGKKQGRRGLLVSLVHDEFQNKQHLANRGISSRDSRNSFKMYFRNF
jgi:hypothetical protein